MATCEMNARNTHPLSRKPDTQVPTCTHGALTRASRRDLGSHTNKLYMHDIISTPVNPFRSVYIEYDGDDGVDVDMP